MSSFMHEGLEQELRSAALEAQLVLLSEEELLNDPLLFPVQRLQRLHDLPLNVVEIEHVTAQQLLLLLQLLLIQLHVNNSIFDLVHLLVSHGDNVRFVLLVGVHHLQDSVLSLRERQTCHVDVQDLLVVVCVQPLP